MLMFAISLTIALAQEEFITALKLEAFHIKKWSGGVLIAVGLFLIALSLWANIFARIFPV